MPTPFDNLTLKQIQDALKARTPLWLPVNDKFYDGDHWQNGEGWSGPRPKSSEEGAGEVIAEIQRAFVSSNAIKETVDRHRDGALGREPTWGYAVERPLAQDEQPNPTEQAQIDMAEALVTTWWDERGVHGIVQDVVSRALRGGRAVLRLYIPPADVAETGQVPTGTPEESINRIWLDVPPQAQATHVLDRQSMQTAGVYVYEETVDGAKQQRAELTFLDGLETVVQIVGSGDARIIDEIRLQLGGRLMSFELVLDSLITEPVRQLQKLLNKGLTMMSHNLDVAGFVERVILNAQMPGTFANDPDVPGKKKFTPKPRRVGPGTTNVLAGLPIKDAAGQTTGYTDPSIVWRDPVDVSTFIATDDAVYRRILKECNQLHALISGDAVTSGESREQALADFLASLLPTATAVNKLMRWLLETVLALTAQLSNAQSLAEGLRSTAECRIHAGPISADRMRLVLEMVAAKLLSRETAMSRLDVDDVDAELARIATEADAESERQKTTLASAVLAARRQVDSGAANNGLAQPPAAPEVQADA